VVQVRLRLWVLTVRSRLDYLLHAAGDRLSLKQVEFNTISLSFRPLSEHAAAMHKCIHVVVPRPTTHMASEGQLCSRIQMEH
jgi:hypothetical protein